jgi:kynurenine 3-monooxygenase
MNAAFEDCTVLAECLKRHAPDWEQAFDTFEVLRKVHTDALAGLCVENFLEMRDRVSSRTFLLRKKAEVFLHRLFPRWYLPLYTLVTFTRTPYADAMWRARIQDGVVRAALNGLVLLALAILAVWLALRGLP